MNIGDRIKELRENLGLSVAEFARNIDVKDYKIRDSEIGKQKVSHDLIESIGIYYDVNLNWLLTGKGQMYLTDSDSSSNIQSSGNNNNNGIIAGGDVNININREQKIDELNGLVEQLPTGAIDSLISQIKEYIKKIPKIIFK